MGFLAAGRPASSAPSCSCFHHTSGFATSRSTRKKEAQKSLRQSFCQCQPCFTQDSQGFLGWVTTDVRVLPGSGSPIDGKQARRSKRQRGNCGAIIFEKRTVRMSRLLWLLVIEKRLLSCSAKIQNLIRFEFAACHRSATRISSRSHQPCSSRPHSLTSTEPPLKARVLCARRGAFFSSVVPSLGKREAVVQQDS